MDQRNGRSADFETAACLEEVVFYDDWDMGAEDEAACPSGATESAFQISSFL